MIITFLLQIASSFFLGLQLSTSGVATLPAPLTSAITFIGNSAGFLNYVIPITSLLGALALVLTVEAALWTFAGAVWIYRHIPFIGH